MPVENDAVVVSLNPVAQTGSDISGGKLDDEGSATYTLNVANPGNENLDSVYVKVTISYTDVDNAAHSDVRYVQLSSPSFTVTADESMHGKELSINLDTSKFYGSSTGGVVAGDITNDFSFDTTTSDSTHGVSFTVPVENDMVSVGVSHALSPTLPTLNTPGGCESNHEGDDGVSHDTTGLYKLATGNFSTLFTKSLSGSNPEISIGDISLKYSLSLGSSPITGLNSGSREVHLYAVGTDIVGSTATTSNSVSLSNKVFSISVDSTSGVVSFKQYLSVDVIKSTVDRAEYNCDESNHEYSGSHENIGLPAGAIQLTATPVIPENRADDLSGTPDTISIGSAVKVSFEIHDSYENIRSCSEETLSKCSKIVFSGEIDDDKLSQIYGHESMAEKADFSNANVTCSHEMSADEGRFAYEHGVESSKLKVTDTVDHLYSHRNDDWFSGANLKVSDEDSDRLNQLTVDEAICLKSHDTEFSGRNYRLVDSAKNIEDHIDDEAVRHASEARLTDNPATLTTATRSILAGLGIITNLDITAPDAPMITGFVTDSGTPSDHLTNDSTPQLQGTGEVGATITVFQGVNKLGSTTVDGTGHWAYQVGSLSDGLYSYTATATDVAGNISSATSAYDITVDTAKPVLAIAGFATDSGKPNDHLTNDSTPQLQGTGEVGATIAVFQGVNKLGTAIVDSTGHWTYQVGSLSDGLYNYTATATDAAGNISSATSAYAITVDTVKPVLAITGFATDSGTINDHLTNDATPLLQGTGEIGSTIAIYQDATQLGTTVVGKDGTWSYQVDALTNNAYNFAATATDAAGNTSNATSSYAIKVDTAAPSAPAITHFITDSGTINDHLTNDSSPQLQGTGEIGSTIAVYQGVTKLGTAVAGVPLQCDERPDFRTFRIGLFGLEKLAHVDRTVDHLATALEKITEVEAQPA